MAVSRRRWRSVNAALHWLNPSTQPATCRLGTGLKFTMFLPGMGPCPAICRVPVTGRVQMKGEVITRRSSSSGSVDLPFPRMDAGRRALAGYSNTQSFTRFRSSVP